jgi:broad specificity phosphatase PhoE
LSRIYLVRHGQAGTREAYDSLSSLGKRQARLLGEYLLSEGIVFAATFSGTLARQSQTALEVQAAYHDAGVRFPEIAWDCGWNEFDLAGIYRAFAPRLCEDDAQFATEYSALAAQARAAADEHEAPVNRRWMPCDTKLVEAWIAQRYSCDVETWAEFHARVTDCRSRLSAIGGGASVLVFTSATPIGIWTAMAMEVYDERALRLAGVLRNASYTVLRLRDGQVRLDSFNAIPHLAAPELRTYR